MDDDYGVDDDLDFNNAGNKGGTDSDAQEDITVPFQITSDLSSSFNATGTMTTPSVRREKA